MNKLTKRYTNGFVTLDAKNFAPVTQETIDREIRAFEPFREAVEQLAKYEDGKISLEDMCGNREKEQCRHERWDYKDETD